MSGSSQNRRRKTPPRAWRRHGRSAVPRRQLEVLENRSLLSTLTLAGGALNYEASFGEANILTVDVVHLGGVDYVRFREDGAGLTITPSGAGLIADAPNIVRAPLAGLTDIDISTYPIPDPENPGDPDLVNDAITIVLDNAMPAQMSLDAGPSAGDQVTIQGTASDDTFSVEPSWSAVGARVLELTHAATMLQIGNTESVTFDISGAGHDDVSLDRYVAGIDRPGAFRVIGGGAGTDSLSINDAGNVQQVVNLADGHVEVGDAPPTSEVFLGRSDNIAIDQPQVAVEVIGTDANGDPVSLGPDIFNTMLLDTGASGILFGASAGSELLDNGLQVYSEGYDEQGVAGFTTVAVSEPYQFDFAGDSGVRNTINDVQTELLDTDISFLGPWGIVGEPALQGRITDMDMSKWLDPLGLEDASMGVDFPQDLPASDGHFYHVPLQFVDFPASGQHPGGPIPTFASLPEIPVKIRENGKEVAGSFLLDTGRSFSVLSSDVAFALGLDRNNDGSLEDEAIDHIDIGGIGGTTTIPILPVDRLAVPTQEGQDLVWSNLQVGIEDITVPDGPPIAGVFGMDFLTSGWATKILSLLLGTATGDEPNGYFSHAYLDFRDAPQTQTGTLVLDVVPEHDTPGPPAASTLAIDYTGLAAVSVATGTGDDVVNVDPSTVVSYSLDGGPHNSGDTLNVNLPPGVTGENDGSTIRVPGYLDIAHTQFENFNVPLNSAGSISGQVFKDINANGTKDAGEGGLASVTVYVDSNNNRTLDPGEPSTTTDSGGRYVLGSVAAGTRVVREVMPAGYSQTAPTPSGSYTVSVVGGTTVSGMNFGDVVTESLSGGILSVYGSLFDDTIQLGSVGPNLVVTVNGASSSFLSSSVTAIRVWGLDGNDIVGIGAGVNGTTVDGGAGNDTLTGGSGNDTIEGGGGNDSLTGGAGNDTYRFDSDSALGSDTINESGGGIDTLDFSATTTRAVNINLGNAGAQVVNAGLTLRLSSASTIENVTGGSLNDTITGNSLANALAGGSGNDTIEGGGGNDSLTGGAGNDTYRFDSDSALGSDTINESGGGIDTLDFSATTTRAVNINLGNAGAQVVNAGLTLRLSSASTIENVTGGSLNDTITGNSLANALAGGSGNDTIEGGGGNDSLTGGAGNDTYRFDTDSALGSDTINESGGGIDTLDFSATTTRAVNINLGNAGGAGGQCRPDPEALLGQYDRERHWRIPERHHHGQQPGQCAGRWLG